MSCPSPASRATPPFQRGDRIELVAHLQDDPHPVPTGARGTVDGLWYVADFWQVAVIWDGGRGLMLCVPPDQARKVDDDVQL